MLFMEASTYSYDIRNEGPRTYEAQSKLNTEGGGDCHLEKTILETASKHLGYFI